MHSLLIRGTPLVHHIVPKDEPFQPKYSNKCSLICEPQTSTATLAKPPDEPPTVAPAMIVLSRAATK